MKLERFHAETMSEALNKIHEKLGGDAVIYSQMKTEKGIEVVAGVARLENKAGRNKEIQNPPVPPEKDNLLTRLAELDQKTLQAELARIEKLNLLQQKLRKLEFPSFFIDEYSHIYAEHCEKEAIISNEIIIKILLSKIPLLEEEFIETQKICALIGPTGIGKSTSIAKIAKRFISKYGAKKLGIISTDFQRIITKNQFHYFGKLLDIEIEYARNAIELKDAIQVFAHKQLTLIDTAGVSPVDNKKLAELLEGPCSENKEISTYLVLPCNLQSTILNEVVDHFRMPHTRGCIMTKKDESMTIAPCLSVVMKHQLPIAYWCDGQNINKDIHVPTKTQLINAVFHGERSDRSLSVPV